MSVVIINVDGQDTVKVTRTQNQQPIVHSERTVRTNRSAIALAYAERVIGSIRRECLDHLIVVNETGLSCILTRYLAYYHQSRTHLSLAKDSPQPRSIAPPALGAVVVIPQVGGLHHRYDHRRAA
jgi:hypothetical protein